MGAKFDVVLFGATSFVGRILSRFEDKGFVDHLGLVGKGASLLFEKGIYEGTYLIEWLTAELARLGVRTFADLRIEDPGSSLARTGLPVGRDGLRRHAGPAGPPSLGLPAVREVEQGRHTSGRF